METPLTTPKRKPGAHTVGIAACRTFGAAPWRLPYFAFSTPNPRRRGTGFGHRRRCALRRSNRQADRFRAERTRRFLVWACALTALR